MKQILIILLMAFIPLLSHAQTEQQITQTIDEHAMCRVQDSTTFAQCASYNIKNSPLGYIESLLTPGAAAFVNVVGSALTWKEISVEPSENTTGFNYIFDITDSLTAILCEVFLTLTVMFQIFRMTYTQHQGQFVLSHGFGYAFINYAMIFFLLVCGGLYALVWGAVFVSVLFVAYIMMMTAPSLAETTVNDPAAYQQRAEAYATEQIGPIFDSMVHIADNNDRMRLEMYNLNLRNKGISVEFVDTAFSNCLKNIKADADTFFGGTLSDGEAKRSQKCAIAAGYTSFDPGSVSYSGFESTINDALIELNNQARIYQYEYKKNLCANSLKVDGKREALKDSMIAYQDCLNVDSSSIPVLEEGNIVSFLPESNVDSQGLRDIKDNAIRSFAKSFAVVGVQYGENMEKISLVFNVNAISFMLDLVTQEVGAPKWRTEVKSELSKISSISSESLSAYRNAVGLNEAKSAKIASNLSGGLSNIKFIDRDKSLSTALGESFWSNKDDMEHHLLSAANFLGGNMFDNAGFTGEDCFQTDNTCQVPYLNQLAASTSSNLVYAQSVFEAIVQLKMFYIVAETLAPNSAVLKLIDLAIHFLQLALGFSFLRLIAGLSPVFVLGGMMLATVAGALFMTLGYKIDLLKSAFPSHENLTKPVQAGVSIASIFSASLWLIISLPVMFAAFLLVLGIYGFAMVLVGYWASAMGASFIGENGQFINSIINFALKIFIFQLLDTVFIIKLSSMAGNLVTKLQGFFTYNLRNEGLGEQIQSQIQQQMQKITKAI
ncbi:hypothetical protein [Pseudomonas juntendi]|uniref:hypothetical protein n=1 Tax=Pseudomonas juntendi TaxID=2666183 RepID=UPI00345DA663